MSDGNNMPVTYTCEKHIIISNFHAVSLGSHLIEKYNLWDVNELPRLRRNRLYFMTPFHTDCLLQLDKTVHCHTFLDPDHYKLRDVTTPAVGEPTPNTETVVKCGRVP